MKLNENKDRLATMLKDTIITFCKNVVSFKFVLNIEGFIVLTCDEENVLVVKIDESQKANFGSSSILDASPLIPGATSKFFALSKANKQPLSLQYNNWNTNLSGPQTSKAPKARQRAPQQKKAPAFSQKGVNYGQRMSTARPRMGGQRMAPPECARRTGPVRQRFSNSFPGNFMSPCNSSQTRSMVPMSGFRQRMPFHRPPIPAQNTQLALQYFPSQMEAGDAVGSNLAICDVASNEVVETTSPAQFLDEAREKMFKDVVSEALSKLDTDKTSDCPPKESAPKSNPLDDLMALVPLSPNKALSSNSQDSHRGITLVSPRKMGDDLRRPVLHNSVIQEGLRSIHEACHGSFVTPRCEEVLVQQNVLSGVVQSQIPCSVGANSVNYLIQARSTSQLQISLVPASRSSSGFSSSVVSSVSTPLLKHSSRMLASTQKWMKEGTCDGSTGSVMQHVKPPVVRPSLMTTSSMELVRVSSQRGRPQMIRPSQTTTSSMELVHVSPQQGRPQMVRSSQAAVSSVELVHVSPQHGKPPTVRPPQTTVSSVELVHVSPQHSKPPSGMHRMPIQMPEMNYGLARWPGGNQPGPDLPRMQHAYNLSNDLRQQLSNIFEQQAHSCAVVTKQQPGRGILSSPYRHFGHPGPQKSNSMDVSSSSGSVGFGPSPSQCPQVRNVLACPMPASFNFASRSSHLGLASSQPAAVQRIAPQPLVIGQQERNIFNQMFSEQGHCRPEGSSHPHSPILQGLLNSAPSSVALNAGVGRCSLVNSLHVGHIVLPAPQQHVATLCTNVSYSNHCTINTVNSRAIQGTTSLSVARVPQLPGFSVAQAPPVSYQSTGEIQLRDPRTVARAQPQHQSKTPAPATTHSTVNSSLPTCQAGLSKPEHSKSDHSTEKRLPPLRLRNLGHGNLMVIDTNRNDFDATKDKEDGCDLETIVMDQVLKAVEGLKEDSSKKNSFENPSPDPLIRNDRDMSNLEVPDCDMICKNLATSSSCSKMDEQGFNNSDAISQIIKDMGDIFSDDLISGNLTLNQDSSYGVFDVCRNEVVVTRNGNVCGSSSSGRIDDAADKVLNHATNPVGMSQEAQKDAVSESSDTTEVPDLNSAVGSCSDVVYDTNSFGLYTCQACQISMDSIVMLAEHYSTFHTNLDIHWRENEVKPYMDRMAKSSTGSDSISLACPFKGCSRTFSGSRQVLCHYAKSHRARLTPKQVLQLKTQEGSAQRCEFCKLKFSTRRLLNEHLSREH